MREKFAFFAFLFLIVLPTSAVRADDSDQPTPRKRVAMQVQATLSFTECVAKLLNNGLGTQEARQLCIDTVAN